MKNPAAPFAIALAVFIPAIASSSTPQAPQHQGDEIGSSLLWQGFKRDLFIPFYYRDGERRDIAGRPHKLVYVDLRGTGIETPEADALQLLIHMNCATMGITVAEMRTVKNGQVAAESKGVSTIVPDLSTNTSFDDGILAAARPLFCPFKPSRREDY
jgi:hypothetical protein